MCALFCGGGGGASLGSVKGNLEGNTFFFFSGMIPYSFQPLFFSKTGRFL